MRTGSTCQKNLILVAGPCQIETSGHCWRIAETLTRIVENLPVDLVFKASFDKANRTSIRSSRSGVSEWQAVRTFEVLRENHHGRMRLTTDVHTVEQVWTFAQVVDVLQIPALLSRQTDLLVSAGKVADVVNVKKGQFTAPPAMSHAVEKVRSRDFLHRQVWLTERGTSFGYGDLVVDMRSLVELRKCGANKVLFDASHSVQKPSALGNRSGGAREFIEPLARAALAVGVDGLFVEVHDDPANALSDGDIAYPLAEFGDFLKRCLELHEVASRNRHSSASPFDAAAEQVHG